MLHRDSLLDLISKVRQAESAEDLATMQREADGILRKALDCYDDGAIEQGDLFEPISRVVDARPFDLIVANPPYIASDQLPTLDKSVREFEPLAALDGGVDGLTIHRRILERAPHHLVPGGRVFLEIAFDQGAAAREMMAGYSAFDEARILKDYGGRDRVLTV